MAGQDWYEQYAQKFGGYRKLWNSEIRGQNGEAAFTAWLRQTIPSYPAVADVGCGDGIYTLHMALLAREITGLDYAPTMIELARKYLQSAAIENARFAVCDSSEERLPFADGSLDLIYSRRGPSSHLRDARRVLRKGGLVAGIHTGGREQIIGRVEAAGFRLLRNEEFNGTEVLPTLEDLALFLSRMPGAPDYTLPDRLGELERHPRTEAGYEFPRSWYIWVAVSE